MLDYGRLTGERCAGIPSDVFDAHLCNRIEEKIGHFIAIPEVMMSGYGHSIAKASFF
jgi:hypothetical protein